MLNLFKWLSPTTKRKSISSQTLQSVRKEWQQIDLLLKKGTPSQMRQALINADRAFDMVLKDISPGDTMGERLKATKDKFRNYSDYQGVWDAHKLRNSLVHEAGFEPTVSILERETEKFRKGLTSLRVFL